MLQSNGKEYPGTPEGFEAMREDCKSHGHMSGHRGDPKLDHELWAAYLSKHL